MVSSTFLTKLILVGELFPPLASGCCWLKLKVGVFIAGWICSSLGDAFGLPIFDRSIVISFFGF